MIEEVVYDAAIADDFQEIELIIDDDEIEDPVASFINKMPEVYVYDEKTATAYQAELDKDEASTDDNPAGGNLIKSEFLIKMKNIPKIFLFFFVHKLRLDHNWKTLYFFFDFGSF